MSLPDKPKGQVDDHGRADRQCIPSGEVGVEEGEQRQSQEARAEPEEEDGERLLLLTDEGLGPDPEEQHERQAEERSADGDEVSDFIAPSWGAGTM
jgi:hypothetical protein